MSEIFFSILDEYLFIFLFRKEVVLKSFVVLIMDFLLIFLFFVKNFSYFFFVMNCGNVGGL